MKENLKTVKYNIIPFLLKKKSNLRKVFLHQPVCKHKEKDLEVNTLN